MLLFVAAAAGQFANAQESTTADFSRLFADLQPSNQKMALAASFELAKDSREGVLLVAGRIEDGWHGNSLGQVDGPGPLKITPTPSADFELSGGFQANAEAKPNTYPDAWPGVEVLEHSGDVVWYAPIRIAGDKAPEALSIEVKFNAIVCSDTCIPLRKTLTAKFGGWVDDLPSVPSFAVPAQPDATAGSIPPDEPVAPAVGLPVVDDVPAVICDQPGFTTGHADVSGELMAGEVAPGTTATIRFRTVVANGYHVYRYFGQSPEFLDYAPTRIRFRASPAVESATVSTSVPFQDISHNGQKLAYFKGDVDFVVEFQVPAGLAPGDYELEGVIGLQSCNDLGCDQPRAARFQVPLRVSASPAKAKPVPVWFAETSYFDVDKDFVSWPTPRDAAPMATSQQAGSGQGLDLDSIQAQNAGAESRYSLPLILVFSLVGGFILNFMPCVLPVIGLKVMSFLQQAGQNRWQALVLNIWYTLGILTVFMILAALLIFFSFGWGKQSQSAWFQIVLASIVFVMSLSFLGVWEIPIPGFVGSSSAAKAAEKEGPMAAFLKGILTTILAVPCSGPGIATALAWCSSDPPKTAGVKLLVFLFMGLGMALPYIVIGVFPGLLKSLPKPGAWMERFKEVMGFVLLATVIWLLWTIPTQLMLPSFAFLFALWFACWVYGRIPYEASVGNRLRSWIVCAAIASAGWFMAFPVLGAATEAKAGREFERRISMMRFATAEGQVAGMVPAEVKPDDRDELHWLPFSMALLGQETALNRTVVVDFTADWCATCKILERTVLNTQKVREFVDANQLVMLMADWTTPNPEIDTMLQKLGSEQIPVLAIFPAGRPNQPIVLRGGYTQTTLLEKLGEAGASQNVEETTPTAVDAQVTKEAG